MKHVAVMGLGIMGFGMSQNLLKKGFPLTVYNRTASKAEPLAVGGATVATTPALAARDAEVILSMLSDDNASREAWLGEEGALSTARPGSVLVESGTVTTEWIEELSAAARQKGCVLLDAPVTGSRAQAEGGELTFLVGGDANILESVRPVFEAMGRKVLHVGPSGSGARLKLINNFLCGVQLTSLAEAVGWLERAGLNADVALEALTNGAAGSPLLKTMSQRMQQRDYRVNFLIRLLEKDLLYARRDAQASGIALKTAEAPIELLREALRQGLTDHDISAVVEQFRKES